ncbi:cation:proton antiporter [Kitasatospora sp. NPDC058965]|uniref:cation:proton antiporter n=1 Tax=Kitasatospora sp. NPDC058965 TaxID=3346682 RepID=UPI0036A4277A
MSASPWVLPLAGAVVAGYGAVSRRLATTPLSGPLVFVAVGLALGPLGLDLAAPEREPGAVRVLLEATLALVLFTDGAATNSRALSRERFLPVRLLGIGLPLSMALGWLVAWWLLPGLGVWELALVAVVLAPTDAALGRQAVADRRVPVLVRDGLSVESGLNDGLALPFFVLVLAAAEAGEGGRTGLGETFLRALVLSSVLGLATGYAGARLLRWAVGRGWMATDWQPQLTIALAALAYGLSVVVEGSGFIGVWVAGLAFGNTMRYQARSTPARPAHRRTGPHTKFAERLSVLATAISFLAFGALILGPVLEHLQWRMALYAVLSLTVVRMLPVAVALLGARLRPATVLYIGWFGPRGLASLVFGLIALESSLGHVALLSGTVAVTVGLSVVLHGASAPGLGARYGAWFNRAAAASPGLREQTRVDGRPAPSGR